jgi:magnesium transporter
MLFAYRLDAGRMVPMANLADLQDAVWVDLYRPMPEQIAQVEALGASVPSLDDMEEIEISNRLYREGGNDYLTVILPGQAPDKTAITGPVTFVLMQRRLITVRHHSPRSFETFPTRAGQSSAGCANHLRVFLGLVEEIVSRQADLLEGSSKTLDQTAARVYGAEASRNTALLGAALAAIGLEGETQSRVRLALLTLERMLSTFGVWVAERPDATSLQPLIKGLMRDIQALEEHAAFLSARVSLISDTTLGMINLAQNATVKILSVVAALFLPPTLIASVYGMNFHAMPELDKPWGYPMALGLMVASAAITYVYCKWMRWL